MTCRLCQDRVDALSPYSVDGAHDDLGHLSDGAVEAIHRIRTDNGRLTKTCQRENLRLVHAVVRLVVRAIVRKRRFTDERRTSRKKCPPLVGRIERPPFLIRRPNRANSMAMYFAASLRRRSRALRSSP